MNARPTLLSYLRDPLALLWRVGASRRLSLLLFALLALMLLFSLLFPQASPGMDATYYAQWLGAVRYRYGPAADWALAWGLDNLRSAWLFRLLLVLLTFNLLISLANQLSASPGQRAWPLAVLLPHLGLVLVLGSFLVDERFGWQESIALAEGQPYKSTHLGELTLKADTIQVLVDERGAAVGWESALSLADQGQVVAQGRVQAGHPWRFRGWLFWQAGYGLAAELVARGDRGQEEIVQALSGQLAPPLTPESNALGFWSSGVEGYFAVPGRGLSFRLVGYDALPQRGIEGAVIHVQAYRSGQITPLWEAYLQDRASLTLDGVEYRFRKSYYALLQLSSIPGLAIFGGGMLLIMAGTLSWAFPKRSRSS